MAMINLHELWIWCQGHPFQLLEWGYLTVFIITYYTIRSIQLTSDESRDWESFMWCCIGSVFGPITLLVLGIIFTCIVISDISQKIKPFKLPRWL